MEEIRRREGEAQNPPEGATADSTSLISSKGGKATVKASERRPEAEAWREEEPWWWAMVGPRTSPEGNIKAVAGAKYVRARVTKLSGTGMPHWP